MLAELEDKTMNKDQRIEDFCMTWANIAPSENDYLVTENVKLMEYLKEGGFFTAPASTKYHGAYEGGLYDHSDAVFQRLIKLTNDNNLEWEREESPFIVGYFHDLCKCDQYKISADSYETTVVGGVAITKPCINPKYEYNTDTILKGHGTKSLMILSRFINLTEEEQLCIRFHMGAYEQDDWSEFDKAIRKYPNVLWTHMADMLASKVDGI